MKAANDGQHKADNKKKFIPLPAPSYLYKKNQTTVLEGAISSYLVGKIDEMLFHSNFAYLVPQLLTTGTQPATSQKSEVFS